jgi:DNA-binding NtrC family response regulator
VISDHGGIIKVDSEVGLGTVFKVIIPAVEQQIEIQPARNNDFYGHETLLFIDDEPVQRNLAPKLLGAIGYEVITASHGEDGVAVFSKNPDRYALVIIDMLMEPGFDGCDTYEAICQIKPGQKALLVSGYSRTERVKQALRLGAGEFLRKPYTIKQIGQAVRRLLDTDK